MKKKRKETDVAFPDWINADSQSVPVIHADPFGTYTGRGVNPYEIPVQDADDL